MKITIMPRKAIEGMLEGDFPGNTAVISFYDPKSKRTPQDYTPVNFKGKCTRALMVGVHDIDIHILKDYGFTYETYLPEAKEIAEFIKTAVKEKMNIICQCEYGQSRSAACAAAILEYYSKKGIKIFADYRYYQNQMIFHKIYDALKELKKSKINVKKHLIFR